MRTISPQPSSNAAVLSEQTQAHGAGQSAKGRSPAAPGSAGAAKDKDRGAAESRALQGGMVTAQNLYVTFNRGTPIENPVLRGLSLSIDKGEFVTVIGSNGAGKSTFLNALTGEQRVDFGKIVIDGQDVTRMPTHKRSPFIARVFQDPMAGTCESLSIEQNLALAFRRDRKVGFKLSLNKEIRDVFRSKLAALNLGLENRLTDSMGLLSGGQRQAVSLTLGTKQPQVGCSLPRLTLCLISPCEETRHEFSILWIESLRVKACRHCLVPGSPPSAENGTPRRPSPPRASAAESGGMRRELNPTAKNRRRASCRGSSRTSPANR